MSRPTKHHHTALLAALAAGLLITTFPAAGMAATSASGTQAVTADVANTLEATFPGAYAWGALDAGATGNTSGAQTINVKSNSSWGVQASTDQAAGRMREWSGAAYLAPTLTNSLNWRLSALGGVGQATSFAAFSSTPALVTGSQGVTSDAGVDVALTFKQVISYADVSAGANDYRVVVSYDVAQGY
jgi:hypothetical protein